MKPDVKNLTARKTPNGGLSTALCRRLLPALIAGCFACSPAWANPTGAQIVTGQVNITNNGNVLTVTNSPGSIINWQSFSIGSGELTQFLQQSASSAVLNRIVGQDPSQIFGALQSNGKVYLINPNGVLFGGGAQVNVGGLVASSLNLSNADFTAGKLNFAASASGAGSVVNQGGISSPNGGNIYLIAPQVQNTGIITSPQGEVLLAAGHSVQLVDGGDPNLQVTISAPADQALNLGQVVAQGGKIGIYGALVNQSGIVSADSAVVGQNGEIVFKSSQTTMMAGNSVTSAQGTGSGASGGNIYLEGPQVGLTDSAQVNASGQSGGGTVLVGGGFHGTNAGIENANAVYVGSGTSIKADAIQNGNGGNVAVWSQDATRFYGNISAQGGTLGGNGGFVETSGKNFLDFEGAVRLTAANGSAGTLLLDPADISIQPTGPTTSVLSGSAPNFTYDGTGVVGTSVLLDSALVAELGLGNVTVVTNGSGGNGDILVTLGSTLGWSSGNSLTLNAYRNISILAPIISTVDGTNASAPNGAVVLTSATGNITQTTSSPIYATSLTATATAGSVVLNSTNSVGAIGGSGAAGFSFNNIAPGGTLVVNNITSSGGTISVTENSPANISVAGTIDAGGGSISLSANNGAILTTGSGIIGGASGDSATLFAGAGTIDVTSALVSLSASTTAGAVTINNTAPSGNALAISSLTTSSSPITVTEAGNVGIVVTGTIEPFGALTTLTATNGSISTSGAGLIGGTSGDSLALSAKAGIGTQAIPLATSVDSVQATNTASGDVAIANTDTGSGLTISGITQSAGSGGIYLSDSAAITVGGAITASNGDVGLQAGTGIAINAPINASGSTVALNTSDGNITQTGAITATYLSAVASAGYVDLWDYSGNAVANVAGSAADTGSTGFLFGSPTGFNVAPSNVASVGTIPTATGLSSTVASGTYAIQLYDGGSGNITIGAPISGGSFGVSITAPGAITSTSSSNVISSTGKVNLSGGTTVGTGVGTPVYVNAGALSASATTAVYVDNVGTSTMNINGVGGGAAYITSVGSVAVPTGAYDGTPISSSSFTLTSQGTISVGNNTLNIGAPISTTGPVALTSTGAMTVGDTVASTTTPSIQAGGAVTLQSQGAIAVASTAPTTISSSGVISLYAGYNGSSYTSGGTVAALPAVMSASSVSLNAGGAINGSATVNLPGGINPCNYSGAASPCVAVVVAPPPPTIDLTVSGESAGNKVYDGTTNATLSGGSLVGIASGDTVTLTQTGSFSSKNVGNGIAVTAADTINVIGDLSGDTYVLIQPTGLSANIAPAPLTVSGQGAASKIYNGNTLASLSGGALAGTIYSGDVVTLSTASSGNFASKNVGSNITVTPSTPDALGGAAAGNYMLVQPTLTANISAAAVTVAGQTANSKTYDGTTAATLAGGTLTGVLPGDVVTLSGNGSFATKNAGNNIAVTAQDSLGGADGGNYTLAQQPTGLTANITQLGIAISATGSNKVYNGSSADAVTLSSNGVLQGDVVIFSNAAANFSNANAGLNKTVTVTGISASGADAGNYAFAGTTTTAANITPAPLTVTGEIASNKVYDGTTAATLIGGALNGVVASDAANVTLTQAGNFASANVGNGITVVAADSLSGSSAANYALVQPTGLMANIVGTTVVTQATPTIFASNSYIIALNAETTTLLNGGGLSGNNSGTTGSGTNNSGATNNGNVKKLYCN